MAPLTPRRSDRAGGAVAVLDRPLVALALRLRAMRISYTSRKRCWIVGSLRRASGVPSNWMRPWSIT